MSMRIVKEAEAPKLKTISIQLGGDVIERIDKLAKEHDMSRQRLVDAILRQALNDKGFVLRVKE